MATALVSESIPAAAGGSATDDPFHDPLLIGIGMVFVLVVLVIAALAGLLYWGTMYDVPSWSANSFPPPIAH